MSFLLLQKYAKQRIYRLELEALYENNHDPDPVSGVRAQAPEYKDA